MRPTLKAGKNIDAVSGSSGKNGAPTEGQPGKSRCTALQKKNAAQSAGITGKIYYGEEVRFSVSEFEAGLQKTRFAPIELKALLEEYFGKPLCSRQEQKETKEKEKNDFWQETAAVLF